VTPLRAAWAVLAGMGLTSVIFNVYHATHAGHMNPALAVLYGVVPILVAMGLSHIGASYGGGKVLTVLTFGIMGGAMTLSIGATAWVVAPAAGHLKLLFGAVLDSAALVAQYVILAEAGKQTALQAEPVPVPVPLPPPAVSRPAQEPPRRPRSAEADAEKARRKYRESQSAGEPLSDRALGAAFGRSRTWGANRIKEVDEAPKLERVL
jgi:hypothetical protein